MNDRTAIASSSERGKDVEQVELLLKAFNNFKHDLESNEKRVELVNELAAKLLAAGHSDASKIQDRQSELNSRWKDLGQLADKREADLQEAHVAESFNRDANETMGWMNEKTAVMPEDAGKDLSSVMSYQRKHQAFQQDLNALADKIVALEEAAQEVAATQPHKADELRHKEHELQKRWQELKERSQSREQHLESTRQLQAFLVDYRDLVAWMQSMTSDINRVELSSDASIAESCCDRHRERKSEMETRQATFDKLHDDGHRMIGEEHFARHDIEQMLETLATDKKNLDELWVRRELEFRQCYDLLRFDREADFLDKIMDEQQAYIDQEELGESVGEVEDLLKRFDEFQHGLAIQEEEFMQLEATANEMIKAEHYAAQDIEDRRQAIMNRRSDLEGLAIARRALLEDSWKLQHFLRDADEAHTWIELKRKTASDEGYKDPSNLKGKLQAHEALAAEMQANEGMITSLNQTGESLISADHFMADGECSMCTL